jgi:hypothetical protein
MKPAPQARATQMMLPRSWRSVLQIAMLLRLADAFGVPDHQPRFQTNEAGSVVLTFAPTMNQNVPAEHGLTISI